MLPVALLVSACQTAAQEEPAQPVEVATAFLAAVEQGNEEAFAGLAQPDLRIFVPGDSPGNHRFEPLTLARMAEFFERCEVTEMRDWAGSVEIDTDCDDTNDESSSYFVLRDGKIALFYAHTQPLMQVAP